MPKKIIREDILFPVILHQEDGIWGYFLPEIGGGGASTRTDALKSARELLTAEAAQRFEEGDRLAAPDTFDTEGGQVVFLAVEVSNEAVPVNITIPASLLAEIDAVAEKRSDFLVEAAKAKLGHSI